MTTPPERTAAHGGYVFGQERAKRKWTQAQAVQAIERMSSKHLKMPPQELSRLELGHTRTPSMESLVAIGETYGMEPNDVATLFGYWDRAPKEPKLPRRVRDLVRLLMSLEEEDLDRTMDIIEAVAQVETGRYRKIRPRTGGEGEEIEVSP